MAPDRNGSLLPAPTLAVYAGKVLKQRLTRMLSHGDGVREGATTEPVHQMRVWSRRTRAALELFHICFDGSTLSQMEREIKRAADALGQARDLDVMIEKMTEMAAALPDNQRKGVTAFIDTLAADRAACQSAVSHAVARLQDHDLDAMLETLLTTIATPDPHGTSVLEFAVRSA